MVVTVVTDSILVIATQLSKKKKRNEHRVHRQSLRCYLRFCQCCHRAGTTVGQCRAAGHSTTCIHKMRASLFLGETHPCQTLCTKSINGCFALGSLLKD